MQKKLISAQITEGQMPLSSVYVQQATHWASELTRDALDRPNDFDGAMRRVSERIGVGYNTLWGLRYRTPKRIFVDIYFRLESAYEDMRQRQLNALEHEFEQAKAGGRHHAGHIRETEAFLARNKVGVSDDL